MPSWKKVIISGSDASLNSLNISTALTASGLIYPTVDGTVGQVITTDGTGNLSFLNVDNTRISIKNVSGGEITKGTPLFITGSGTNGNIAGVVPADAGNPSLMPAGVIAGETLADGAEGVGLINGYISGVNTSLFAPGDEVFVAVGGGYTNIAPTGSALIQKLGNVEKSHETAGSGVINGPGATRSVPNILPGYSWVGNSDYVATPVATSSFFVTSGSHALTASYVNPLVQDVDITGNLTVTGTVTAQEFYTELVSSSIIYESGSTKFGDTVDDTHQFTGSVDISGSTTISENLSVAGYLEVTDYLSTDNVLYTNAIEENLTNGGITFAAGGFGFAFNNDVDITGSLDVTGNINATSFTGSIAIGEEDTLSVGSQIFYPQGTNGFSVNEDFDPSNSSLQTAYHFTSGVGRETVAFTLARTGQFTDGFGIYGTAADNTFVMFGEQNNTSFEWRRGVGIRPLDLDGGTLLARLNTAGQFSANSVSASSGITGSLLGNASTATSASYAVTASYSLSTVTSSLALENLIDAQPIVGGIEFTKGNGDTFSINLTGVGTGGSIVTSSFNNVITTFYNHNFNSRNVLVKVYDNSFNEIIPATLTLTTADKVDITFASPQSGKVVIIKGDGVNSSTGSFSNTVSASFSHTLNTRDLNLGVYDQSFNQIIPATLTIPDSSNVEATFDSNTSGYIVAIARGNRISSSYSTTSSVSIPNQLGTLNVQVNVYDTDYSTIIPDNVQITQDVIKVDFASTGSGHIVAMGGPVDVSRSTLSTSFRTRIDGASTYNIQHNLDEEWPLVQVYQESTRTQVTPLSIVSLDDDTIQINFTGSFTGHVIINS